MDNFLIITGRLFSARRGSNLHVCTLPSCPHRNALRKVIAYIVNSNKKMVTEYKLYFYKLYFPIFDCRIKLILSNIINSASSTDPWALFAR